MSGKSSERYAKKNSKGRKSLKRRSGEAPVLPSSYHELNPDHVIALIQVVVEAGGAVIFNRSRDGGALGLRVLHDAYEPETLWGDSRGDFQEILESVWNEFRGDD